MGKSGPAYSNWLIDWLSETINKVLMWRRTFPCMMSRNVSVEGSATVSSNESAATRWLWFVSISTTTLLFWSSVVAVPPPLASRQPPAVVGVVAGSASSTGGHSADGWALAGSVGVATACILPPMISLRCCCPLWLHRWLAVVTPLPNSWPSEHGKVTTSVTMTDQHGC